MLWECPAYDTSKKFMGRFRQYVGGSIEDFSTLINFEKTCFVLGCENWDRYDF